MRQDEVQAVLPQLREHGRQSKRREGMELVEVEVEVPQHTPREIVGVFAAQLFDYTP